MQSSSLCLIYPQTQLWQYFRSFIFNAWALLGWMPFVRAAHLGNAAGGSLMKARHRTKGKLWGLPAVFVMIMLRRLLIPEHTFLTTCSNICFSLPTLAASVGQYLMVTLQADRWSPWCNRQGSNLQLMYLCKSGRKWLCCLWKLCWVFKVIITNILCRLFIIIGKFFLCFVWR